ncbi:hypothetical protein BC939DRAFT_307032 [Gamsiella multidivaricata]|uniref:uncharacterized protein n=1 Tax=Gamsiella multidivaricata TaxID=101098 RepID=UPI0022201AEA|nr:uncharacterized protein BC939DRAFT_307032 [Gamsiella multidivaricata]KAI7818097.1 hypothetical protein BC939DRAFT_307032 [Gamsiella multidivaricata]
MVHGIPIGSWDTHGPVGLQHPTVGYAPRPFHSNEDNLLRDSLMAQALQYLNQTNILQYRQLHLSAANGHQQTRFLIYALDSARNHRAPQRRFGEQRAQKNHDKESKQALSMVLLNMNVDPLIFSDELELPLPGYTPMTIFQDDKAKHLLNIYLDMPSPRAADDPFVRTDARPPSRAVQQILRQTLERDSPKGMRTRLYDYQKNSLWKLLRRELYPDYILDPTLVPMQDMEGRAYYINMANDSLVICRNPESKWDDIPGGIICEDMGTGKSCICIALIMQTLHQSSKPPTIGTQLYCELYSDTGPSATVAQDGLNSVATANLALVPGAQIPDLRDLAAAAVKLNQIDYKRIQDYINPGSMELLEDLSVYYYAEDRNARSNLTRAKQLKTKDRSPEIYLSTTTLVIVPPNLMDQWCNEHTENFALKLLRIEPGKGREIPDHRTLLKHDMVLISLTRFAQEYEPGSYSVKHTKEKPPCLCDSQYISCHCRAPRSISPLMQIRWKRVIVDEGHSMGLKLSDHTLFADHLHADRRWICTGTPTFNLANLKPSSFANVQLTLSDKGDLERLATLIRSFLHLQPYYGDKNLFSRVLIRSLEDHYRISTGEIPDDWSLASLSSASRLRYLMDRIMVRNKPADVERDVRLPPLHERIVRLELDYYQALALNCQVALIQANAVLTEREDQDYFFHPSNRKHLARVIENLKDGCFWYLGGSKYQEQLSSSLENVQRGIERHEATVGGKYPEDDFQLLKDVRQHINDALSDKGWNALQRTQEVGYYCSNLPTIIQRGYATVFEGEESMDWEGSADAKSAGAGSSYQEARGPEVQEPAQICVVMSKQINTLRSSMSEIEQSQETSRDASGDDVAAPTEVTQLQRAMTRERLSQARILSSTSSKLNYIADQILRHRNSEKCIVFCQSLTAMYYISEYLTLAKVRFLMYHTHGMTEKERSSNIMTFNTSENVSAIIMDTKHAAFGIDLSSASRVYFLSPVWQTATMRQAIKRAHRIGQMRPVYVETLVIRDSFEEAILTRRNEIDKEESSGTAEVNPTETVEESKNKKKKSSRSNLTGKKGMEDDGKMREFISHIGFMSVPSRIYRSHAAATSEGPRSIQLSSANFGYNETMDSSSGAHVYPTVDDYLAFQDDDRDNTVTDYHQIPLVFPSKRAVSDTDGESQAAGDHQDTTAHGHTGADIDCQDATMRDHYQPFADPLEQSSPRPVQDLQKTEEGVKDNIHRSLLISSSSAALPERLDMLKIEVKSEGEDALRMVKFEDDTKYNVDVSIKPEPDHYVLFDYDDDDDDDKKNLDVKNELMDFEEDRKYPGLLARIKEDPERQSHDIKVAGLLKREPSDQDEDRKDDLVITPKAEGNRTTPNALKIEQDAELKRSPSSGAHDNTEFLAKSRSKRLRFE